MSQNQSQLIQLARDYQRASRAEKSAILERMQADTGWSRDHCRRSLRKAANPAATATPGRPAGSRKYSTSAAEALEQMWHLVGQPSGRRLQAMMPKLLSRLDQHGELCGALATAEVRTELLTMSSASIDRYLRAAREHCTPTLSDTDACLQQRLAEHETVGEAGRFRLCAAAGPVANGSCSHIISLGLHDKLTGWRMRVATPSTSPRVLFPALNRLVRANPVPLRSIDVHTGSELLNFSLISWAHERNIAVSPSSFATSDTENANQPVQCDCLPHEMAMYERQAQLQTQLWEVLDQRHNYLLPITRAKYKVWTGSSEVRVFDSLLTPLQRLEASLDGPLSSALRWHDECLNPAAISREAARLQAELARTKAQHAPAA